jgi:hypothetical protein
MQFGLDESLTFDGGTFAVADIMRVYGEDDLPDDETP